VPRFVFLDPFGLGLPFNVITEIFTNCPAGLGAPATGALVRIDSQAVYRTPGVLEPLVQWAARALFPKSAGNVSHAWRREDSTRATARTDGHQWAGSLRGPPPSRVVRRGSEVASNPARFQADVHSAQVGHDRIAIRFPDMLVISTN
jgi:hypothetical protein